mmetsp:Transcript_61071/g.164094  ORF Transcript_61071/g.164094 Transcript_61071/m.164094 type:complete len:247 (-) Transcript_61071:116-856(-)
MERVFSQVETSFAVCLAAALNRMRAILAPSCPAEPEDFDSVNLQNVVGCELPHSKRARFHSAPPPPAPSQRPAYVGAGEAIELPDDFYDCGPHREADARPCTHGHAHCLATTHTPPANLIPAAQDQPTHAASSSAATTAITTAPKSGASPDIEAVFADLRRRLDRLRRLNMANRGSAARREAAAMLSAAAGAGCKRIASRAARLLLPSTKANREAAGRYLSAGALDEVEVQLDAAEALWRSCRVVV